MHIDYKVTIWERIHFKRGITKEEVIQYLKENPNIDSNDLFGEFGNENEVLYDTAIELTPKDNDGSSTINFIDDDGNLLWDNVDKSFNKKVRRRKEEYPSDEMEIQMPSDTQRGMSMYDKADEIYERRKEDKQ